MKVNQEQWNCFLDYAEMQPEIITNRFHGPTGRARASTLWARVVIQLNSFGYAVKSVKEWRKAVADWKCKVKAKVAKLNQEVSAMGDVEGKNPPLTKCEERLLYLLGEKGVERDNFMELGIPLDKLVNKVEAEDGLKVETGETFITTPCSSTTGSKRTMTNESDTSITSINTIETKTPSDSVNSTRNGSKRRRLNHCAKQRIGASDELIVLTRDNVNVKVLKTINKNLERQNEAIMSIAKSLNIISEYYRNKKAAE